MPEIKSKFFAPNMGWTQGLSCLSAAALLFCAPRAVAQAPAVTVDSQQTIGSNYSNPQSVAVAPNGTVYVADTTNNEVVALVPNLPGDSSQSVVDTSAYVLSTPKALAVDAAGDLFIADSPVLGLTGRVIEVMANGSGVLTSTVNQIYSGGLLKAPISLAVDNTNTLFIGDIGLGVGGIYTLASGGTTPTLLSITGLLSGFTPASLVRDSSTNLYFVDQGATNGGVYVVAATGGAAQPINAGSFVINQPTGVALDASGDLFILALLAGGSGPSGQQVVEIPGPSPTTPFIVPTTGLLASSGMALDPSGNVYVAESANGQTGTGLVTQLNLSNSVSLGSANVTQTGPGVTFNFEFNAPAIISGFRTVTLGDLASKNNDVVEGSGGTCTAQTLPDTVSAYSPYTCTEVFQATPQYTGVRISAIQVEGSGNEILDSSPVYETGLSAAQITYPLDATATATGLIEPQGLAISGFDQTVYIADLAGGAVYATGGLNGTALNMVGTGTISLQAPSAVAINGEGDLFIADFDLGEIAVVPTTTGKAPSILETGNLLQHPISLALDYLGNLYIGDSGAEGDSASSSNPGYIVEVPYNGLPFKLPTPSVTIIFPQSLATDSLNGNLLIGDGGDVSAGMGQVVKVTPGGATASVVSVTGATPPTDPTGLAFDAAENLYVLDGVASTITVVPPAGDSQLLGFANTSLASPSALANSAGSQSFVIANVGNGSNNSLVYLNGNSSTLAFGNVVAGGNSATQTATVHNIGNQALILANPFDTLSGNIGAFDILNSSTCTGLLNLTSSASCTFNVQFTPATTGAFSEQVTINSNGYNTGTPLINLSGTGTASPDVVRFPHSRWDLWTPRTPGPGQFSRKSFHRVRHEGEGMFNKDMYHPAP